MGKRRRRGERRCETADNVGSSWARLMTEKIWRPLADLKIVKLLDESKLRKVFTRLARSSWKGLKQNAILDRANVVLFKLGRTISLRNFLFPSNFEAVLFYCATVTFFFRPILRPKCTREPWICLQQCDFDRAILNPVHKDSLMAH